MILYDNIILVYSIHCTKKYVLYVLEYSIAPVLKNVLLYHTVLYLCSL